MIKSKLGRVDPEWDKEMIKDVALARIQKGLEKKMLSSREITKIMRNAPSYQQILRELKSLPRRKKER